MLVSSDFQFKLTQQGPPGHAHGGASASVIDEAMGACVWQSGYRALLADGSEAVVGSGLYLHIPGFFDEHARHDQQSPAS